ncbi:dUTP diphosphatase [Candidatus Woesearchaeota archaeon]|nr:dUTP diphosphatase [Candidatus Woesearchaeota archaeon]
MVEVRVVKLIDWIEAPTYAHPGDAGLDIRAAQDLVIKPSDFNTVKTGLKMSVPEGYVGLIWDKSGYASKHGIHVLAGVIDSGYRGEICVVLKNLGTTDFKVQKNMKIAQLLIQPIVTAKVKLVESLDETQRNEGGFGSTGKH